LQRVNAVLARAGFTSPRPATAGLIAAGHLALWLLAPELIFPYVASTSAGFSRFLLRILYSEIAHVTIAAFTIPTLGSAHTDTPRHLPRHVRALFTHR